MWAYTIHDYATGLLTLDEIERTPPPEAGCVQLKLNGTSVNPIDQMVAKGYGQLLFNPNRQMPLILGRDALATVTCVGRGVNDLVLGQRVWVASSPRTGGVYSEFFNLPRRCLAPVPFTLADELAAGVAYTAMTALQALTAVGLNERNTCGRTLCIHGASGGVGSLALLIAARWGAVITAVASSASHDRLQSLADCRVVDYRDREALASIRAEVILNFAAPSADDRSVDPLLMVDHGVIRAYATTVTPLLREITRWGVVRGAACGYAQYLRKHLMLRRMGINYRWVMFQENPLQLQWLGDFLAGITPEGIMDMPTAGLTELPAFFHEGKNDTRYGKRVFMIR